MLRCVCASASTGLTVVTRTSQNVRTFNGCTSLVTPNSLQQGQIIRCFDRLKHRTFSVLSPAGRGTLAPRVNPPISTGRPAVPSRGFRTSRPHSIPPVFLLFIQPLAKLASIITGRTLRRAFQQLPEVQKQIWRKRIKRALPIVLGTGAGLGTVNYYLHLQETPITKRKRYIAVTPDQFMKIAQYEYELQWESLKDKVVVSTHPQYKQMERVVKRLIAANQDIDLLKKQEWTLILVENPERNAFVLPTGHIFVYTGLMDMVLNEDQLAVVLGHEMAHAILLHGAERMSFASFIDTAVIFLLGALWFIVPSDGIAIITHWFFNKVVHILMHLPYDRKLETEADDVGLELIAKACYDVRESCNFWDLMMFLNEVDDKVTEVPEIFSTHPSNTSRIIRLGEMVPKALGIRDSCKCPRLSERDPSAILQHMKAIVRANDQALEEEQAAQSV